VPRLMAAVLGIGILLAGMAAGAAQAEDYPSRPIRVVVGFGPGAVADVILRVMATRMTQSLGQQLVVENRPGAGSSLGAEYVARAPKDGYTLLMCTVAQTINPAMNNLSFDFGKDLAPITLLANAPQMLVAHPSLPANDVRELIALAKSQPDGVQYASSGVGTLGHLVVEYVAKRHDLKLTHIPYNTAAFADIIAGRVPMGSFTWGAALGQVQSGTLRALAVTTEARRPEATSVPTFKELGYDLVASTWFSFSGPKGLPKEIVQRLNEATIRILELPEVKKRVIQDAFDPKPLTPEQLLAFMEAETARWTPIAQAAMKKQ